MPGAAPPVPMMKWLKKLLAGVLVLVALVVVAGAVFVSVFDANDYRAEISEYVGGETGRAFRIGGDIQLALWPDIGLAVGGVEMADARGFGKQPFLKVEQARVIVRLLPLLSGEVQVAGMALKGAHLKLVQNRRGVGNWEDLVERSLGAAAGREMRGSGRNGSGKSGAGGMSASGRNGGGGRDSSNGSSDGSGGGGSNDNGGGNDGSTTSDTGGGALLLGALGQIELEDVSVAWKDDRSGDSWLLHIRSFETDVSSDFATRLQLEDLAAEFDVKGSMQGVADGVDLRGVTLNTDRLSTAIGGGDKVRRSLTGDIALALQDGRFAVAGGGAFLKTAERVAAFLENRAPAVSGDALVIESARATLALDNGVGRNDDLSARLPLFNATGEGRLDLAQMTADYTLYLQLKGGDRRIPVRITGPLDNLDYDIPAPDFVRKMRELTEQAQQKIKREAERAKEKVRKELDRAKEKVDKELERAREKAGEKAQELIDKVRDKLKLPF